MRRTRISLARGAAVIAALALTVPVATTTHAASLASTGSQNITHLASRGTTSLGGQTALNAISSGLNDQVQQPLNADQQIPGKGNPNGHVPAAHVPTAASTSITTANPGFFGFSGLSHRDQRLAGTDAYANTQFSLEPPDQMLCTNGTQVLEGVNNALATYTTSGATTSGPTAFSQFWGLTPEINRTTLVYGDFVSDPRCYYDWQTSRWFITELQISVDSSTGNFSGPSHILLAVSQTPDANGTYNRYSITTTNAGTAAGGDASTPNDPNCPCFGDQPLIGADANGFYISTNEYPIASAGFNGLQLYAISKRKLEVGGALPAVVHFGNQNFPEGPAYTVQPATTPPNGAYASNNGGTEYFLSALDYTATTDNRIAVWALTNTSSLDTATPSITLSNRVISSELYGQPPNAQQKSGPTPLADSLNGKNANANGPQQKLELLSTNDDRMQQVTYSAGHLFGALNTVVKPSEGPVLAGIAYFVVAPSVVNNQAEGTVTNQGYVAANRVNVMYPAIAVNAAGVGDMSFSLSGPDYYPSTGYISISTNGASGPIHLAGAGVAPEDGFTGYRPYGGNGVARWGDYSAAEVGLDGRVYMASEYIPGPRTVLANWGTYISIVTP